MSSNRRTVTMILRKCIVVVVGSFSTRAWLLACRQNFLEINLLLILLKLIVLMRDRKTS